jgi:hypothetical protein
MTTDIRDTPATKRPRKMAREPKLLDCGAAQQSSATVDKPAIAPKPAPQAATLKGTTKTEIILSLLTRAEGATLQQMVDAMVGCRTPPVPP